MIKKLFVVIAHGGKHDDDWHSNVRAFNTHAEALALIENYVKWLNELREIEEPEGYDIDWDCEDQTVIDEQCLMDSISKNEFWLQVMIDIGIPEEDREFMDENKKYTYGGDKPGYMIEELEYQDDLHTT